MLCAFCGSRGRVKANRTETPKVEDKPVHLGARYCHCSNCNRSFKIYYVHSVVLEQLLRAPKEQMQRIVEKWLDWWAREAAQSPPDASKIDEVKRKERKP